MTGVLIKNVKKSYGDVHVIHDLSVEIRDAEFLVFVGPSGCGKSTLLRMIAGLESFDQGQIFINEKFPACIFFIGLFFHSFANHTKGGWIYYKYLGLH